MTRSITPQSVARGLALLFAASVLMLLAIPNSNAQIESVVINEIVAGNDSTATDGDGDFSDWIELRNLTSSPIDLEDWQLNDDAAIWQFPAGSVIDANGYLIVWASDKDDTDPTTPPPPAGEIHTSYKLSTGGESVTLINTSFQVESTITYPVFPRDNSYGRTEAGNYIVRELANVSHGFANPEPPPTATPTATAEPGVASILINEVMVANTTIPDAQGNFEDWIELYNPTCDSIDINGWQIRDSRNAWVLQTLDGEPPIPVMDPGDVVFIWASNKGDIEDIDYPGPAGQLHTNFRLAAEGEAVFLVDDAGLLVDELDVPPGLQNESYGITFPGGNYSTLTGAAVTANAPNPGQVVCTPTPTPTPSATPTITPTATSTPTPLPTATPGGPTVTPTPTPSVTPPPTATPTSTSTPVPTPTATSTPTPIPTATPVACASSLVINELQSRNRSTIADGDGDFSDWIELYNPGADAVGLTGWRITDSDNSWPFPAGTVLDGDSYALVWASDKGDPRDADFPGPVGELHASFRLSGSGETVTLFDQTNCAIDSLTAPALAVGHSFGVTRLGDIGLFERGFSTPGVRNEAQAPPPFVECYTDPGPVRFNRFVASNRSLAADADGDFSDFIELYNTSVEAIDIGTWSVADESSRWEIPTDTIIDGQGTLVIWASGKGDIREDDFPGPAGELHADFKLSTSGEVMRMYTPAGCVAEEIEYPELGGDQAYGYDSDGALAVLLPGSGPAACAAPGSVIFVAAQAKNETTRTDEDGDFGDWFELRNTTDASIALDGWVLGDDGDSWIVPSGVSIEPGVDLVVWADEKNRGGEGAAVHTNFKLGSGGETLTLGSTLECPVDRLTYPELDDDQVWRLGDDGLFALSGAAAKGDDGDDDEATAPGDITVVGTCIAINELMAKNDTTLEDDAGDFGDWIELVNLSDEPIDLSGYEISDDKDAWTIPDGVEIEANGFLLLWADEGDSGDAGEELHTNFKLGGDGEAITLVDADGAVAASLSSYPELDDDESFGVNDEGDYVVRPVGDATPGEGPVVSGGCDFEVGAAAASPASAEEDSESAEDGDAEAETEADVASAGGDGETPAPPLATTGTNARTQSLLAQFLLITGIAMVLAAHIAKRRAL